MSDIKKCCDNCLFCFCIGTKTATGDKWFECHKNKPKSLGENTTRECDSWEKKDNVIRIWG